MIYTHRAKYVVALGKMVMFITLIVATIDVR